ncbi:hypothetical protein [Cupriavidus pauculus]|uniref:hypothetical protein n=1 Tax=Cupriavidus pauculus TaxID=82633 RepID=UPI003857612B
MAQTRFSHHLDAEEFLHEQGFRLHSTGGGYEAWFYACETASGASWHVSVTNYQQTGEIYLREPLTVALEAPDGAVRTTLEIPNAEGLPAAIEQLRREGLAEFGAVAQTSN